MPQACGQFDIGGHVAEVDCCACGGGVSEEGDQQEDEGQNETGGAGLDWPVDDLIDIIEDQI